MFLTSLYEGKWSVTASIGFTTQKGFIQPADPLWQMVRTSCPTGGGGGG